MISLTLTGRVDLFAEITPSIVRFNGAVSAPLKQQVRITPDEKNPFKIIGSKAREGKYIRFEVKETMNSGRPGYVIDIENTRTDAGAYQDNIMLETDSKIRPQLNLRVFGSIFDQPLTNEEKSDQPKGNPDQTKGSNAPH